MQRFSIQQSGVSVIEVVVGVSIMALVMIFIGHAITLFFAASGTTLERTHALYLAEEGIEAVRFMRDSDWSAFAALSTGSTQYLDLSTTTVTTTLTPEIIDGVFTRSFTLETVARNGSDDIVTSGGSLDPDARVAVVTVAWGSDSVTLETLLTNVFDE